MIISFSKIHSSLSSQQAAASILRFKKFLIFGSDAGSVILAKRLLVAAAARSGAPIQALTLYYEDIASSPEALTSELCGNDLFSAGSTKIITINGCPDNMNNAIFDIIDTYSGKNYLICAADELKKKSRLRISFEKDKHAVAVNCYKKEQPELEKYIIHELNSRNVKYNRKVPLAIIDLAQNNLLVLQNEIEKIANFYESTQSAITESVIEQLLNNEAEIYAGKIVGLAIAGSKSKLLPSTLSTHYSSINETMFVRVVQKYVINMLDFYKEKETSFGDDQIISKLSLPFFGESRDIFIKACSMSSTEKCYNILELSVNLEREIKLGLKKDKNLVNFLLIKIYDEVHKA